MIATMGNSQSEQLLFELLTQLGLVGLVRLESASNSNTDQFFWTEVGLVLSREQLQKLPSEGAAVLTHNCILLPNIRKDGTDWFPFVWIRFPESTLLRIQVVVAGISRRFGFRWESPESGEEGVGKHDYWHVQPITSVRIPGKADRSLNLGDPPHVCENLPTIPVDVGDPVQMLDAMLVSIYGPRYTFDLIDDASLRNQLHEWSDGRAWANPRRSSPGKGASGQSSKKNAKKKKK